MSASRTALLSSSDFASSIQSPTPWLRRRMGFPEPPPIRLAPKGNASEVAREQLGTRSHPWFRRIACVSNGLGNAGNRRNAVTVVDAAGYGVRLPLLDYVSSVDEDRGRSVAAEIGRQARRAQIVFIPTWRQPDHGECPGEIGARGVDVWAVSKIDDVNPWHGSLASADGLAVKSRLGTWRLARFRRTRASRHRAISAWSLGRRSARRCPRSWLPLDGERPRRSHRPRPESTGDPGPRAARTRDPWPCG